MTRRMAVSRTPPEVQTVALNTLIDVNASCRRCRTLRRRRAPCLRYLETGRWRREFLAASKPVLVTIDRLHAQPWADTKRIVLEGQSGGGLATVAAGARRPEGVLANINPPLELQ